MRRKIDAIIDFCRGELKRNHEHTRKPQGNRKSALSWDATCITSTYRVWVGKGIVNNWSGTNLTFEYTMSAEIMWGCCVANR